MTRKARTPTRLLAGMSALILVLGALIGGLSASAALSSISGFAYGERVARTEAGVTTVLSGPLPTAGPFNQATPFSANNTALSAVVTNLLTTGPLNAQTAGTLATGVNSSATVAAVNALSGALTATLVSSQCVVEPTLGGTSGSTTLAGAVLNGVALPVNPLPNTSVTLSVGTAGSIAAGTVTLNEQLYDPATNTLTVNAIHIRVTSGSILGPGGTAADIIISHVECDAIVVPVAQPPVVVTPTPTPVGATPTPTPTPTPVGATPTPTPVGATPTPFATPTPVAVVFATPRPVTPSPAAVSTAAAAAATRAPAATTSSARSGLPATSTAAGAGGLGLALVALGLAFLRRRQTTR